jgi:hypothetical protein
MSWLMRDKKWNLGFSGILFSSTLYRKGICPQCLMGVFDLYLLFIASDFSAIVSEYISIIWLLFWVLIVLSLEKGPLDMLSMEIVKKEYIVLSIVILICGGGGHHI